MSASRYNVYMKKLGLLSVYSKGFTLIELIIALAIFVFMTVLLVSKYGTFNSTILTTNVAYDIAITIRQAQAYGLHFKVTDNSFTGAYGAYFTKAADGNTSFKIFNDLDKDGLFTSGPTVGVSPDETVASYNMRRNSSVVDLKVGTNASNITGHPDSLHVVFKRPDPDAIIAAVTGGVLTIVPYAEVVIVGPDESTRRIVVSKTGQISIEK